jgi:hypothetical protein
VFDIDGVLNVRPLPRELPPVELANQLTVEDDVAVSVTEPGPQRLRSEAEGIEGIAKMTA